MSNRVNIRIATFACLQILLANIRGGHLPLLFYCVGETELGAELADSINLGCLGPTFLRLLLI